MELETSILGSIIPRDLPVEEDDLEPLVPSAEIIQPADSAPSMLVSDRISLERVSNTLPPFTSSQARSRISATTAIPGTALWRSTRLQHLSPPAAAIARLHPAENLETEGDPLSYREALSQSCSTEWKKAIQNEYASLLQNQTWDYVDSVPAEANSIACCWVFRKKINPDGSLRYKARLVIKGYEQIPGVDLGDTFAPVAKLTSLRLFLGHVILNGWETHHLDVVTAFLNRPIDNSVFMNLPEGIEFLAKLPQNICGCHLKKALYRLKQAPRLWFQHINSFLKSIGFIQSANDPNLYLRYKYLLETRIPDVILLLYVDDLLISARNLEAIEEVKALLQAKYSMNNLGPVPQFLGLEVLQDSPNKLRLYQSRFITTVLMQFKMTDCNGVQTPMEPGLRLLPSAETDDLVDQGEYQSLIGSLMYFVVGTRPDIAFAVATLSKFNSKPSKIHYTAAKRVLRYLKQTKTLALTYHTTIPQAFSNYNPQSNIVTGLLLFR